MKKYSNEMKEVLSNFDFGQKTSKLDLSKPISLDIKTDELFKTETTNELIFDSKEIPLSTNEIKTSTELIADEIPLVSKEIIQEKFISKDFFEPNLLVRKSVIKVIGIGGAGNNIVDFIASNMGLSQDVMFYQLNTDSQHLQQLNFKSNRILIKSQLTNGMGSGGDPECGRLATEDFQNEIRNVLSGADVCIIVAGLGKGTGTGGSPVVGKIAKSMGILTLAFATMPSTGEGKSALDKAIGGLKQLKTSVDAITTISNEKTLHFSNDQFSIFDAYKKSNYEIGQSIKAITDIILTPSYQNIDLADVRNFFRDKNNINYFVVLKERFLVDEVKNINKIINRKLDQLVFEQSLVNAKSIMILFYANKEGNSQLYANTTKTLKEITKNKDLNIVYGIVETEEKQIGFDIIALNSEPTVLKNTTLSLPKKHSFEPLSQIMNTQPFIATGNILSRKFIRNSTLTNQNNLLNKTANKLEDDFNDLIETKKISTDQMSRILNRSVETYFDKKSNKIVEDLTDYDDLNLFKS